MTTTVPATVSVATEPAWRTYLRLGIQILPALLLGASAAGLFVPKMEQIWADAGNPGGPLAWILPAIRFLSRDGGIILVALLVTLGLYELRATDPARYRRPIAGLVAFIVNTGVLVGLWLICLGAAVALPAISRH